MDEQLNTWMDWIWSSRCLELLYTSTQSSNLKWVSGGGINSPGHSASRWLTALWKSWPSDEPTPTFQEHRFIQCLLTVEPTPTFQEHRFIRCLLTVDYRIKVHLDLQEDKSLIVVKGPFFPRVNPRYRIRGTMCNARIQSSKARKAILWRTKLHLI
jgi:hypothetical protein